MTPGRSGAGEQAATPVATHHLAYRDGLFYCECGKFHGVRDIDDAKAAQRGHEASLSHTNAPRQNEPPELAPIRARHAAATPGPMEWVGPSLEGRDGAVVVESEVRCGTYCYGGSAAVTMTEGDRDFTQNAHVDMTVTMAGLDAVVALHSPRTQHSRGVARRVCDECSRVSLQADGVPWPCRTFSTLSEILATTLDEALRSTLAS